VRELGRVEGERREAEGEYLAYVKGWQVYGSSFFFVEPQMSQELPHEVFLTDLDMR
jgi:hypothetical protein